MFETIKNIFRKKSKPIKNKINYEDPLVLTEDIDITYENEVKKIPVKETKETKSSLTFGK